MKMKYQDKEIEVREVGVLSCNEHWNEYQLDNGSVLQLKTILISVFEAVEEKAEEGGNLYVTKTQTLVKVGKA